MGDTGSLFLGGAGVRSGLCAGHPAHPDPLSALIYIVRDSLRDIIQVTYFKLTHGKRIFRMAPLHHHLEMGGWSETKLFTVFTAITAVCCILAYLGIMNRFPV